MCIAQDQASGWSICRGVCIRVTLLFNSVDLFGERLEYTLLIPAQSAAEMLGMGVWGRES